MILIGQYDSPFVRRVAVALNLLGLPYEHRPWSAFGDAERLGAANPLRRVPTLVLEDGEVLVESAAILDHLDEVAGERRLIAPAGAPRRAMLRITALATGLCDKLVAMVYERLLHPEPAAEWLARCAGQAREALAALEAERAACATPFWFGTQPGHPDIAVACALRFLAEAHPGMHDPARHPHLAAHAARCEALPAFAAAVQPFLPPPGPAPAKPPVVQAPPAILAAEAAPRVKPSNYPPNFAVRVAGRVKRPLGDLYGLRNFGVNLTTLQPGGWSALHHVHSRQDEMIYVVAGEPTLLTEAGATQLRPGMVAGFPAGGTAHHLENRTDRDCVILEIGDRTPGDTGTYPDDDLQAVLGPDGRWSFTRKDGTPW